MSDGDGAPVARHSIESRIALAMLPLGGAMAIVASLAVPGSVVFAGVLLWRWPAHVGWWLAWTIGAGVASVYLFRKGIETMSTFDWHVAAPAVVIGVTTAALYPGWWL